MYKVYEPDQHHKKYHIKDATHSVSCPIFSKRWWYGFVANRLETDESALEEGITVLEKEKKW